MRISPAYIRNDARFKHGDTGKIDAMVFNLAGCAFGAEVPLLAYDLSERLPAILRPAQDELLCALCDGLDELQPTTWPLSLIAYAQPESPPNVPGSWKLPDCSK